MFSFSKIMPHEKEVSKESEKTCKESSCILKTTFLQHPCEHLFLCIIFSTLSKTLLNQSFYLFSFIYLGLGVLLPNSKNKSIHYTLTSNMRMYVT